LIGLLIPDRWQITQRAGMPFYAAGAQNRRFFSSRTEMIALRKFLRAVD
jgi:hypothetical protein